ncbi:MAG: acetolactate synthase small subunit [Nitrospirae bacterium]|nr:acetolactate synthase small subunit [Candidatus Troglogloeales bacterium]
MQHIISVLVENKFGVLARVSGLFSGRGFNIDSLSVGPTLDPTTSMMTIVTAGDDRIIEQITKQLNKLVDVIRVVDLTDKEYVERETALIKIHAQDEDRGEALRIADIFRARIVDSTPNTYTIEITGDSKKIGAILNLLKPLGIKEFICTGRIAIAREEARVAAVREEGAPASVKDRRSSLA